MANIYNYNTQFFSTLAHHFMYMCPIKHKVRKIMHHDYSIEVYLKKNFLGDYIINVITVKPL